MWYIKNGDTKPWVFLLVDSTDYYTAETGKSPACYRSKNGGSFATMNNTPSEIGNGWYSITPEAGDVDTDGPIIFRATASGCAEARRIGQVVSNFPANVLTSADKTGYSLSNAAILALLEYAIDFGTGTVSLAEFIRGGKALLYGTSDGSGSGTIHYKSGGKNAVTFTISEGDRTAVATDLDD